MSKRYPISRWVLPAIVDPGTSVCFQVPVPNDALHIAAFKGAIYELAKAYSWENDAAHTAKEVAAVWLNIFNNLQECEMVNIRIKPTNSCILQLSNDGGLTWSDVADLRTCADIAVNDGIQQRIDDGQLAPSGQPGAGGTTVPGQCYDYDVQLLGNGKWQAPISVDDGDLVTISRASGGWVDSLDPTGHVWRCPDGNVYALGQCLSPGSTSGTDPLPTSPHMCIVANWDTTWVEAFDGNFSISAAAPTALYLQANDDSLMDNGGSVSLHIQICKGGWAHTFNFKDNHGDWGRDTSLNDATPVYSAGNGWTAGDGRNTANNESFRVINLARAGFSPRDMNFVSINVNLTKGPFDDPATQFGFLVRFKVAGVATAEIALVANDLGNGIDLHFEATTPVSAVDEIQVYLCCSAAANNGGLSGAVVMSSLTLHGPSGTDPF